MTDLLSELLSTRDWLLGDGATGTTLFNMGLEAAKRPRSGTRPTQTAFARFMTAQLMLAAIFS